MPLIKVPSRRPFHKARAWSAILLFLGFAANSGFSAGWTTGAELAPGGTITFSSSGTAWSPAGLTRYNSVTDTWKGFPTDSDGSLAVQANPSNGYYIWTISWKNGCAAGNTWMYRLTGPSNVLTALDVYLAGTVTLHFGNNELQGGDVKSTLNPALPASGVTVVRGDREINSSGKLAEEVQAA